VGFSAVQGSAMTVSWTRGSGSGCIVLVSQGAPVSSAPVPGTSYTTNTYFGGGSPIGSGNYVVYLGANNSVTLTDLRPTPRIMWRSMN